MRIAVVGPERYPSFNIRGKPLALANGWEYANVAEQIEGHFDVIWMIKRYNNSWRHVRNHCDRLIFDPLDWWHWPNKVNPVTCWQWIYERMPFDELIATSPACADCMRASCLDVPVHMIPHQCDPVVKPDWHDHRGPVVYCGQKAYIHDYEQIIKRACAHIGREFRPNYSANFGHLGMEGAALALAIRSENEHRPSMFSRYCKAQTKVENAAAARCPVLCGGHECEVSLHPECRIAEHKDFMRGEFRIAELMRRALDSPPPSTCYRPEDFYDDARTIVEHPGKEISSYGQIVDGAQVSV